ncbi:kinesin-like protein KIF26B isoform X1 [Pangasianodon hypophthalmus]|uniref:kinesin-like protein KIF26B isoform X1 n=1 Tax=Pangasianodon hypophthalmus TaxID=310915 RepID=UPI0023078B40|nr:kinesin-like protein KIF26B isoform X1 [Pangasianodon hypophthalmus]
MGSSEIARKQRYLAQMTSSKSLSQAQCSAACVPRAERLSPEGAGASGASGASGDSKFFTAKGERPATPDAARLCEECVARVLVFKEQALRVLKDGHFSPSDPKLSILLYESLRVPVWIGLAGCCDVCFTHLSQLKREAIHMLLNQNRTIWPSTPPASVSPGYDALGSHTLPRAISSRSPSPNKRQKFSNPRTESWVREHSRFETLWCANNEMAPFADMVSQDGMKKKKDDDSTVLCRFRGPLTFNTSKVAAMLPAGPSAAFSFIVRAVQKLHLTSRRRKQCSENDCYPTNFCGLLQKDPPPAPLNLLQTHSKSRDLPETAKVRVMLRLNPIQTADTSQSHALKVDLHKKQVTVLEPAIQNTQRSAAGTSFTPKTFTFDATFGPESSQAKVCERSLCEVLQSVVAGADGCILSFGQTKVGTSYTMIGRDDGTPNLGIIPCAISWLFKLINKKKDKTWANISVSVSAVEVCGETEVIRDLLSGFEAGDHTHKPNVYLQEDPVCGIQLYNNRVLSAPTAERAACLLDAALASRNTGMGGCRGTFHHHCHMFYTLHVCQKHIKSSPTSGMYVEQSKLSLIDLGSCTRERTKNNTEVCLLDLGNVIMAKLNGHKHVPKKGSKLAMLMQESLGNVNCHTTIVAHVSTSHDDLSETLCTIQIVSRIRRLQRIRKQACNSPGARSLGKEKKGNDSSKLRAFRYAGSLDHNFSLPHLFDDVEDYSGSEKSCDTVFCVDPKGVLHDKEVRGNQEFVPIIPSLQRNKADLKSSFSIKHCDILHLTQNSKEMKKLPTPQNSSAPDLECFKCNTFAELQNRLGCINESEMAGSHSCKIQPANAVFKSEPLSSKVVKIPAEKPEIQQFPCIKQANNHEQGQPTQRDAFIKDIKETPCEYTGQEKITKKILPSSPRFHMASSSMQCERDTESQNLTKTTTPSVPFPVEGLSSDKSTLPPKIRIPPVGKSSSSLATALASPVPFPITRCEVIPQFPTENQGEKTTITVTVQQPLDLNGHDELIYSVVKEVEVSGPIIKGKAAKIANIDELDSLKNLPLGSQPVKIIGNVGKEQTAADSVSEVQALGTTGKTSSDLAVGKTISMGQNHVVNSKTENNPSQLDVRSKESQSKTDIEVAKTDFGSTFQYETSRFRENAFEVAAEQEDAKRKCNQSSGQLCREFKDKVSPTNQRILEDFQMKSAENIVSSYSTYDTSSLTRAWLDADKQHTCKDSLYPCTSWENETSYSPKTTLEKNYVAIPSLVEWAEYSKSMPSVPRSDNNSPSKKNRKQVQPTLTQTTSENQLKSTNPKSPIDESTKLFSAKLEQLTNRSRSLSRSHVECAAVQPFEQSNTVFTQGSSRNMEGNCTPPKVNRHLEKENCQNLGSKGNLEAQYASAHAKSIACPGLLTVFEADLLTLSQANHSLRRVPRFFPLYDVDESDTTQPCKHSQSNMSSVNKVLSSPVVHKLSGTAPNLCVSPKSNRRSINRSSSLSPDGFSRKQISWSSQSLSRKQAKASISSKYPSKILNGRVEVLRASEDSLSSSSPGSSDIDDLEESKRKIKLLSHTLPSPYSRITAPRKPNHCSGHASDNTSVLSGELPPAMCKTALLYDRNSMVSSGYESLKRDSETTYSSTSIHDSISDQSCFYSTLKGARSSKKRNNTGSHQRHPSQDTLSSLRRSGSGSKIRWVDHGTTDAYEIKVYEIDNVDSLQRRGKAGNKSVVCFSAKLKFLEHRQQRIAEMRAKYNTLKRELELAKQHLMVDPEKWMHEFDLWQTFEVDSLEHLEALELVTQRLECQVFRCKAHVMMVTSFDASPKRRQKKKYRPPVDYKGFIGI